MKKRRHSRIVNIFARIFRIPTWFDWERVKSFSLYIASIFARLFKLKKNAPLNKETFKGVEEEKAFREAQRSLNLSDSELLEREKALFRLSMMMTFLALFILSYAVYHFAFGTIRAGSLSLIIMAIAATLAFRYHFWYYQIKNRKLGCSFNEWLKKGLLGEKHD